MTNFASKISGVAMLALAALPMAALATAARADTVVKVRDINLLSAQGAATFDARASTAMNKFCADRRNLSARAACRAGVTAEINEKLAGLKTAQLERASQNLAAR